MMLGMVALSRGDLVAAHDHLIVALRSRMTYGFHSGACEALNALAARCALGGDQMTAARLFGAASAAQVRLRGHERDVVAVLDRAAGTRSGQRSGTRASTTCTGRARR